jgi:hypothetical protein
MVAYEKTQCEVVYYIVAPHLSNVSDKEINVNSKTFEPNNDILMNAKA